MALENESASEYPSDLYVPTEVLRGPRSFDDVTDAHLQSYQDTGVLVIEQAFGPRAIQDAVAGLLDLIDGKNGAFKEISFEASVANRIGDLTSEQRQDAVRKLMGFCGFDARLSALSAHPMLMALVGRLIGHPPEMFQDMALLKPPRIGREKPWHQDLAYFDVDALTTPVVGCWIALDEATVENGCMHVVPGSHHSGPQIHVARRDWQICDRERAGQPCAVVPLKPGGLLLFSGLLQHGTPRNDSPLRRRALQFHYRPSGTTLLAPFERMRTWGAEGKGFTC